VYSKSKDKTKSKLNLDAKINYKQTHNQKVKEVNLPKLRCLQDIKQTKIETNVRWKNKSKTKV
jgi:hypothetical protein